MTLYSRKWDAASLDKEVDRIRHVDDKTFEDFLRESMQACLYGFSESEKRREGLSHVPPILCVLIRAINGGCEDRICIFPLSSLPFDTPDEQAKTLWRIGREFYDSAVAYPVVCGLVVESVKVSDEISPEADCAVCVVGLSIDRKQSGVAYLPIRVEMSGMDRAVFRNGDWSAIRKEGVTSPMLEKFYRGFFSHVDVESN